MGTLHSRWICGPGYSRLSRTVLACALFCTWIASGARASSQNKWADVCPDSPPPLETFTASAWISGGPEGLAAPPLSLTVPLAAEPYAREVRLGPLDVEALLEQEQENPDPYKRLRIGIGRTVEISAADGQWNALPDGGYLWTLAVVSEQAVGMRLYVSDIDLPPGGELRFISAAEPEQVDGPFTAAGPFGTGGFWSTILAGDAVYVEYRTPPVPAGVPDSVPFVIDRVQHLYRDPVAALSDPRLDACHNDVACYSYWADVRNAVAGVAFVGDEYSLVCTGELINSIAGDLTPYFLTAGHCIDSEWAAESMIVYWKYQTSTCDGTRPSCLASLPAP
ncbi:MAG: hypothetical protein V2A79_06725 [Planctomycetota bacterium]